MGSSTPGWDNRSGLARLLESDRRIGRTPRRSALNPVWEPGAGGSVCRTPDRSNVRMDATRRELCEPVRKGAVSKRRPTREESSWQ